MTLKSKIEKIIEAIKDTKITEIEISSLWGAQKIKLKQGGEDKHKLTKYEMPKHRHGMNHTHPFDIRDKDNVKTIEENIQIILLEGIFALYDKNIRDLMEIKIFVDTPSDVRILRRIKRDVNKRKRTIESVIEQYNKTVRPMFIQYVKPTKEYADLIIPYGGKNKISIDTIVTKIKKYYI